MPNAICSARDDEKALMHLAGSYQKDKEKGPKEAIE